MVCVISSQPTTVASAPTVGAERSVHWDAAVPAVRYLDQRRLPQQLKWEEATEVGQLITAITELAVRGAPAIGIAGAYGVALIRRTIADPTAQTAAIAALRQARPTAINLALAVDRVADAADPLAAAQALHRAQILSDRAIAAHAQALLAPGCSVLTHCHTGGLATAGEGTALGAIIAAHRVGGIGMVYVDETRPLLQGGRLTQWELQQAAVPSTLIIDSAAAGLMARGEIDLVMVGADRIAQNRDTANKIGTYGLAVAAHYHGIPFYVAAPEITFDTRLADGTDVVIEERDPLEVRSLAGHIYAASGPVLNPAFDITPSALIRGIITELGIR